MKKTLLLFLWFFTSLTHSQETVEDGLFFSSREVIKDKRTSLHLTAKKPLPFKNSFSLEFESNFRQKDAYYGNIFKIVTNNELNIDLISNFENGITSKNPVFLLIVNNAILFSYKWKDIPSGGVEKWMKFRLDIDKEKATISLSINGEKRSSKLKEIVDLSSFDIVFGKSNLKNYITTDVSPMSIKHIKVYQEDQLVRNWILGKHLKNNNVLDEISNNTAVALNPIWLLDQHLYWSKSKNLKFNNLLGTAQDEKNGLVFFIDRKAVYVYNLKNQSIDSLKYTNKPFPCQGNNFIYNEKTKEIWSYSFDKNNISKFNFSSSAWSSIETNCDEPNFWHHNKMINPQNGNLVTFGGYGHYKYKNSIKTFDTTTSTWNSISNSSIEPRYLSAGGILNKDTYLVFGGYGSKSGNQAVNSHCYYDLFSVDFNGYKTKQIWQKTAIAESPFVPISSLVIDAKSNHFYALIYDNNTFNSKLKLARFGINKFDMNVFPGTIPYKFLDIKSNGSLFLDPNTAKLYALTSNEGNVSLYSLAYPPLLATNVFQEEPFSIISYGYLLFFIVIIAAIILFYFLRKSKSKKVTPSKNVPTEVHFSDEKQETEPPLHQKIKTSAIYLFGGFEVFDKEGKDITALFTPTVKQLFLLILLSKSKNEKGITSNKIIENIWEDKSENSARNNKNVNISKLKLLLEKIGDVSLNNENTYWTIQFGDNVFCDYSYLMQFLPRLKSHANDDAKINEFLNVISAGDICPDVQIEWIEPFKVDISNRIIDGLEYLSNNQKNLTLLELIVNTILKYDPLNEEAIVIKCKTLYAMGKKGLAKQSYDDFCKEYLHLLDAKFNVPFKDIIEG